jgi:hypothetical protein
MFSRLKTDTGAEFLTHVDEGLLVFETVNGQGKRTNHIVLKRGEGEKLRDFLNSQSFGNVETVPAVAVDDDGFELEDKEGWSARSDNNVKVVV